MCVRSQKWQAELMERYQLPVRGLAELGQIDICGSAVGLLSAGVPVKCVSRSACCVAHDSPALLSPFSLSTIPPHLQALSDFCSDPNTFVINSTQFNTATSSGSVSTMHCPSLTWLVVVEFSQKCPAPFFVLCCFHWPTQTWWITT